MNNPLQTIYEEHHAKNRGENFSLLEKERGEIFSLMIGEGKKVLDIGCRDGALTKYIVKGNHVVGVDIDAISLARARENFDMETRIVDLNGSWDEIAGEFFDAIVAGEILEHLYYPEKVILRIVRHLKPKGVFMGSVPNAFSLKHRLRYLLGRKRFTPLEDLTHINHFSFQELRAILSRQFYDVKIIGLGRFSFLSKMLPSLIAFDFIFVAKSPR